MPEIPPTAPHKIPIRSDVRKLTPKFKLAEMMFPIMHKISVYIVPLIAPKSIPFWLKCLPAMNPERKEPRAVTMFTSMLMPVSDKLCITEIKAVKKIKTKEIA